MYIPDSDLGVYAASGAFAILVYVIALAVLRFATDVDLSVGTTVMLTGGFLLFMGSYVAAMVIYRNVEGREDVN